MVAIIRGADKDDIVVEMAKHSSISFNESLLYVFNQALSEGSFDESWHTVILQMLPKEGKLDEFSNWRLIAVLQIVYKVFSKTIYNRISSQ